MKTFVLMLLVAMPLMADELVLKDGRKIEFKTLSDEGDSWEVTTPQGTKLTVKKADFDKLVPSGIVETPLTGATFTFDKKRKLETVDLLSRIDPKRDAIAGEWKMAGGALAGRQSIDGYMRLQLNYTPPEEYNLTMVIEHKEGNGNFHVGLIGGGKQFTFGLGHVCCGLEQLNGSKMTDSDASIPGRFFTKGARVVTFMVRKEGLVVQADGKDFFTWKADWDKLSLRTQHAVTAKNVLFLVIERSDYSQLTYTISRLIVTSPKQ